MLKKERKLYKSGENNRTAYKFNILSQKERRNVFIALFLCFFAVILTCLEILGVTNWHKVNLFTGAVDGIKIADTDFAVYYLDVGQSDCSIVVCDDKVMVIDTGSYPQTEKIREALYALEVKQIDYLVITHQHDDHMSGAEKLMNVYDVKNIIMPALSKENAIHSETYERLLKTIADNKVNPISAQEIEQFNLGSSKINILSPNKQFKELNNMSIVMRITYGENSFLFQGDAESQVEKSLIYSDYDLTADVLKLGHHGSKTASSEEYLDAVKPDIAVISCGQGNSYGHPRVTVMEYLVERNIDYYVTAYNGDITIGSDGKNIKIFAQYESISELSH